MTSGAPALILSAALLLPAPPSAAGEEPVRGESLTVYHVVMGPGDAIWERFGHNAIWISDRERGRDVAYNWGLFDFAQEDFLLRFVRGHMDYWMDGFDAPAMMEQYARMNRTVEIQELRLTPAQRIELRDFLEWNAQPENRFYRYDYFRDNCSTRVRDALDLALGGALEEQFQSVETERTWRDMVREVTEVSLPDYLALEIGMGPRTDRRVSAWEEMFIPMDLRDRLREVRVPGPDGELLPLVVSEEVLFRADRPDVEGRSRAFLPLLLLCSALLAGGMILLGRAAARGRRGAAWGLALIGSGWGLLSGLLGLTLLVMWLATDHVFAHRNINLLQMNPLGIALAALVPLRMLTARAPLVTRRVAEAAILLSVLGLLLAPLPWIRQANALVIAVALPLHLGVWWSLREIDGQSSPSS